MLSRLKRPKMGLMISIVTVSILVILYLITLPYFQQNEMLFIGVGVLIPTVLLIGMVVLILKGG